MTAVDRTTDTLVVGSGPGGYVGAIRAGQRGLDVTLVEEDAYGGTCLNYGCIPSKAMITAMGIAHDAATASEMGIEADPSVDLARMVEWKDGVVDQLTGGVEKLNKANGVDLVEARAEFVDDHTARLVSDDGEEAIEFEHAIVATGSRPLEVPGFSFADDPVLDSRQALALTTVPDSLVIVGAGYIGMELAAVFAKLGTDVTVVEMLDSVLPGYDDDLTRPVKRRAEELGIDFHFGAAADRWEADGDGIVVVTQDESGDETSHAAEYVLVAVGRRPVTDTVALENVGVSTTEQGFIATDEHARTEVDHVFAVGDVAGEPMLAHKASAEGLVAAETIAGEPASMAEKVVPAAVFTEPEIGTVGLTETAAREAGHDPIVGEFPFRASGRALTTGETDGFVRLVAEADGGTLLGAQIVGPEAAELVAEVGLAVDAGLTVEAVGSTIHAHPTLAEAVMEAAENALDQAIHTLNR